MNNYIKKGVSIWDDINHYSNYQERIKLEESLFLVLPSGLDVLEEILKEELASDLETFGDYIWNQYSTDNRDVNTIISKIVIEIFNHPFVLASVFARFKKEHGVDK